MLLFNCKDFPEVGVLSMGNNLGNYTFVKFAIFKADIPQTNYVLWLLTHMVLVLEQIACIHVKLRNITL